MNKQKSIRMTEQRKLILNILRSTKSHPTADWIYQEARKEIPNISLGTVYRNLKILVQAGEILEMDFGSGYSRYDSNPPTTIISSAASADGWKMWNWRLSKV